MSSGNFNQSYVSRPAVVSSELKAKHQREIDQQVAEFLAAGGQIQRFELIRRDINGRPLTSIKQKG